MATVVKPVRPGTYIKVVGLTEPRVAPSAADVVAVSGIHDWGPTLGTDGIVTVFSPAEFDALYGNSDTALRRNVLLAFTGQGAPFAAGAGGVAVARVAGADATSATVTVGGITVTAKYPGARGARLSLRVEDDPNDATRDRVTVLLDGIATSERYSYPASNLAALRDLVAARSSLISVTVTTDGTALVGGTYPLTGGVNGVTITPAIHTALQGALEVAEFSVFALNLTLDAGTTASWDAFVEQQDANNRPISVVLGGAAAETIDTAVARSVAFNNPRVVNVGVGSFKHELFGERVLSTADLAPLVAGIVVARGEGQALTFARVAGLTPVGTTAPNAAEIERAIQNGVVVFSRSDSPDASVKIEKGVTTFTSTSEAARPLEVFSDPRMVRVLDLYVRRMKRFGDDVLIGAGTVNDDTRDAVRVQGTKEQQELERRGLIVPGTGSFDVENTDAIPELRDSIPFRFGWQFTRTLNYVFGDGRIR